MESSRISLSFLDTETKFLLTSADRFSSFLPLQRRPSHFVFRYRINGNSWNFDWILGLYGYIYIPSPEGRNFSSNYFLTVKRISQISNRILQFLQILQLHIYISISNCSIYHDNRYSPIIYNTRLSFSYSCCSPSSRDRQLYQHSTDYIGNTISLHTVSHAILNLAALP